MDSGLPVFPSFDCEVDKSSAGVRWEKWISRLDNLFQAMDLDETDDDLRMAALVLHYGGERVQDIWDTEKGSEPKTFKNVKTVLTAYFKPKENTQLAIYNFRGCKQKSHQSLDEYVTELRQMAKDCKFANEEDEILSQLIQHCTSNRLRRLALREPDKKLKDILNTGRTMEAADAQAATMESKGAEVHAVTNHRKSPSNHHFRKSQSDHGSRNNYQSRSDHRSQDKLQSRPDRRSRDSLQSRSDNAQRQVSDHSRSKPVYESGSVWK